MKTFALLALALVPLVPACMTKDSLGSDSPESQMDQNDSVQAESDLMVATTDGADQATASFAPGVTSANVAATIAANINTRWGSCAAAVATGANVAVTYTDCTGPRHLVHVTGELDLAVTLDVAAGTLAVHGTSDSLKVNGADLVIDATATYSRTGDDQQLVVHTNGAGVGPRGNEVDHTGDYTATWNATTSCGSIAGHWQTDVSSASGSAERSSDVDVMRCGDACPTGTLTHHYLRGASLTITFDGTATARWTTSVGGSGTFALQCQ